MRSLAKLPGSLMREAKLSGGNVITSQVNHSVTAVRGGCVRLRSLRMSKLDKSHLPRNSPGYCIRIIKNGLDKKCAYWYAIS